MVRRHVRRRATAVAERLSLRVRSGDAELVGTLTSAAGGGRRPAVVYVHGAGEGTRGAMLAHHLEETLPRHGIGVLAFDRRGEGKSTGSPQVGIDVLASDVCAWLARVREERDVDPTRVCLFAHSQGGWIAPVAAVVDGRVAAVVAVSPAGVTPGRQMDFATAGLLRNEGYDERTVAQALRLRSLERAALLGEASIDEARAALADAAGEPWLELAFVDDPGAPGAAVWASWVDFDVRPALDALDLPALVVFGARDAWVPVEESAAVWRAALGDRLTVVHLPEAGHFPTRARDPRDRLERGPILREYERALIEWLETNL